MKKKKIAAVALMAAMVVSTTGCGGTNSNSTSGESAKAQEPSSTETIKNEDSKTTEGKAVKVGLILGTGGLGDKNFNDMSYAGMTKAQEDFGIEFDYVEPTSVSDYTSYERQFAETNDYDLIIAIGSDQEDSVVETAEEFPEQKISLIDSSSEIEGVSTVQTKWQEQTFLAGVIAGLGTVSDLKLANEDNVIGVILGKDLPELRKGVVGFTAGAKFVNPDVEVLDAVVGEFNDPGKGKEVALSMYNKGADFIQTIAGASGFGVFAAAKEADRYAFGVGTNQNSEDPDHIVASSARSVDMMVYNEVKNIVEDTWKPGLKMSGIAEGALNCDIEYSNVELPENIKTAFEDIKAKMASGEITPPVTAEELNSWVNENQYTK